jgi:hypothetical protein
MKGDPRDTGCQQWIGPKWFRIGSNRVFSVITEINHQFWYKGGILWHAEQLRTFQEALSTGEGITLPIATGEIVKTGIEVMQDYSGGTRFEFRYKPESFASDNARRSFFHGSSSGCTSELISDRKQFLWATGELTHREDRNFLLRKWRIRDGAGNMNYKQYEDMLLQLWAL